MRLKSLKWISASLALLFLLSCITVNIYFPEAEVKKAAEEIVDEIRKGEEEKEKKDKKVQMMELDQMSLSLGSSSLLLPSVYAQQETQVSTPKIRALKQSLKERFPKLKPFFDSGNIGETNDGFIKLRDESGLNLKDKALLRNLVNDENNDRRNMYAEVAVAMEIDASQVSRIQKIFAQLWVKDAQPGWWIQKENGEWVKKQ
ncbi:MAG: YdbL family protein [Candidatus Aminicenantes bacterium]|nr:YdbL family protein [Candidatus Aminicenantes bacterium]MDH5705227.1 YdbL family protein [Candidatus Aminicenantes bacterium]